MSLPRHRFLRSYATIFCASAAVFFIVADGNITLSSSTAFLARPASYRRHGGSSRNSRRGITICCRAIKVTIRIVGRSGEEWLEQACAMYEKRLAPNNIEISTIWHKTNDALCKAVLSNENNNKVAGSGSSVVVLLDPEFGKSCTSLQFAEQFYTWAQDGGSRLVFVIGGADGLPKELRFPVSSSSLKKPIF
jgi:23S rRNA (pseudouridine1915-N3)-methyltransferase